ncbi:ABC transporter permease [Streptomyces tanashiensis]|uniref:ABC transporter permease n=1 Tax=Streptomyces tanashiensis TaxID=67367 RepID=A0ABY6QXL8_9ACTN|nr:FtsX-like permease family protein [Streptomyces tanashiensis]UZX21946.1 ABC transporter permease [Streptomyces tanashiensis]GGY04054.1 membrane protein [Streptomyces tanashiensis]
MSPGTWTRDLSLGARFAVTGGRSGLLRTLLTATGVGFGVALLLLASSFPNMLFQREVRESVRAVDGSEQVTSPRPDSFLHLSRNTVYRDDVISGLLLRPEGDAPPLPPGAPVFPGTGEMLVSPALGKLLDSPEGALLKERLPYRTVGTIGQAGLIGPAELRYVAHVDFLDTENLDGRGTRYGWSVPEEPMNAFLILLVVVACVVLLLPVLVFIATAVRFGGEQRDRRLAALRLIGADTAMTRRIAAGESLASALLGLLVGLGLFAVARQFAGTFTIWDVNAYPGDVVPMTALAALVLAVVPVASVVVSLFALRGVVIEPLGVVRTSTPRRRRLWWRLLLLVAGGAFLVPLVGDVQMAETSIDAVGVVAGTTLALIGLTTLLPWLVEAGVKRMHAGPVAWQLAVRRLQLSSGTAARAVSGIVVAATGAIALQMLFQAMETEFTQVSGEDTSRAQITVGTDARNAEEARGVIDRIARTEGVTGVIGIVESHVWRPGPLKGGEEFSPMVSLRVGDCPSLREFAALPSCTDGDVFVFLAHGAQGNPDDSFVTRAARPGALVALRDPHPHPSAPKPPKGTPLPQWRIPATAKVVDSRPDPTGMYEYGVLATPSAIGTLPLDEPDAQAMVRLDPAVRDAADHVRNTADAIDPTSWVRTLKDTERDAAFSSVRTGILVGSTLTMLLVAASLLVATLEQLRDRKRLLSSLVAFGTRRSTLGWSVLWQTAVPILLGLALSVAGGLGLGVVLLKMGGQPVQDWWSFLPVVGIGLGLIAVVTLLSMPVLWRLMRADGLRTE